MWTVARRPLWEARDVGLRVDVCFLWDEGESGIGHQRQDGHSHFRTSASCPNRAWAGRCNFVAMLANDLEVARSKMDKIL